VRIVSNAILATLPANDLAALNDGLSNVMLEQNQLLGETGAPVEHVVFPTAGMISVVAELASGERVETALIGRTGVFGGAVAFGGKVHITTSFVQIAGAALTLPAVDFARLVKQREGLRATLFRYEQFLLTQAQQSVACNARHSISQRLATWLIRASDTTEQDTLLLTQEFLAQMLGVQRASVSLVAKKLQDDGLINYWRGRIDILDEKKLGEAACECCHTVRLQYRRLFGNGPTKN
jgi:CRP-like cAMP-binding protein